MYSVRSCMYEVIMNAAARTTLFHAKHRANVTLPALLRRCACNGVLHVALSTRNLNFHKTSANAPFDRGSLAWQSTTRDRVSQVSLLRSIIPSTMPIFTCCC